MQNPAQGMWREQGCVHLHISGRIRGLLQMWKQTRVAHNMLFLLGVSPSISLTFVVMGMGLHGWSSLFVGDLHGDC